MPLIWQGKQVSEQVRQAIADAMVAWHLHDLEPEAKRQLYPGHGEDTGAMKRSVHGAPADYNWPGDHNFPGPERSGRLFTPTISGDRVSASFGSGQNYAIYYHQGHSHGSWSFAGRRFIVETVNRLGGRLIRRVEAEARKRKL